MKPFARRVSHREILDAIDDVLDGGIGAMLEATAELPLADALDFANRTIAERDVSDRVRAFTKGPWLNIDGRFAV